MTVLAAPAEITRTPDHHYIFRGVTYPGVTSILRVLDKSDSLMAWASRMTAEAAVAMAESLPTLIASTGPDGAIKALTARSAWKRDEAAALGTEVHALADQLHRGELLPEGLSDAARERVQHYLRWWEASGWQLMASEAMVVNTTLGYGGTLDLYAMDRDRRQVLADVKTGKAIYHEAVLQMTAYGMAEYVEWGGSLYVMPRPDRYAILHATAEETREVEVTSGTMERDAFRACIDLYRWRESMKGKRL